MSIVNKINVNQVSYDIHDSDAARDWEVFSTHMQNAKKIYIFENTKGNLATQDMTETAGRLDRHYNAYPMSDYFTIINESAPESTMMWDAYGNVWDSEWDSNWGLAITESTDVVKNRYPLFVGGEYTGMFYMRGFSLSDDKFVFCETEGEGFEAMSLTDFVMLTCKGLNPGSEVTVHYANGTSATKAVIELADEENVAYIDIAAYQYKLFQNDKISESIARTFQIPTDYVSEMSPEWGELSALVNERPMGGTHVLKCIDGMLSWVSE